MWMPVLAGIAVGIYQALAMRVYMRALGTDKGNSGKRVILAIVNVVLVLGLIVGFACVSKEALLWSAGGMCATMIVLALALFVKSIDKGQ